jgi:hypothetical protein
MFLLNVKMISSSILEMQRCEWPETLLIPSGKKLRQVPGSAYPCTVTIHGIRLHLDTVQVAFCTRVTGPCPSPT